MPLDWPAGRSLLLLCRSGIATLALATIATVVCVPAAAPAKPAKLEPALQARVLERARELPRLRSLLISVDGERVEERYYHGARADLPANLKSASKTILSALIGIALERGVFKSIHEPIGKFFPGQITGPDALRKQAITIEDLLTMRSGLESTSSANYGSWVQSRNWIAHALARPLVDEPGGRMIYSTGSSHLLSAALTRAAGVSTLEFARRFLADPLGVSLPPWLRDPQGIYFGGNEMRWTPRAMLAFGELYLNAGRINGIQVVPEAWIRDSWRPRTRSSWSGREYGYGWWMDTLGGQRAYFAWGHGGQFIFVVPGVKLVAAITSSPIPGEDRREHQRALYDLLEQEIIPGAERHLLARRDSAAALAQRARNLQQADRNQSS
jgi:CubicO group peptidase (beta-lactamase class C family)